MQVWSHHAKLTKLVPLSGFMWKKFPSRASLLHFLVGCVYTAARVYDTCWPPIFEGLAGQHGLPYHTIPHHTIPWHSITWQYHVRSALAYDPTFSTLPLVGVSPPLLHDQRRRRCKYRHVISLTNYLVWPGLVWFGFLNTDMSFL